MAPSVDLTGVPELRAAALALRSIDADLRRDITKGTRSVVTPAWSQQVSNRVRTKQDRAVLGSGVKVTGTTSLKLVAAGSRKRLSGGLVPTSDWRWVEFGSLKSRGLPRFQKGGRVLYPSIANVMPRIAALWAQTSVRLIYKAFEEVS